MDELIKLILFILLIIIVAVFHKRSKLVGSKLITDMSFSPKIEYYLNLKENDLIYKSFLNIMSSDIVDKRIIQYHFEKFGKVS